LAFALSANAQQRRPTPCPPGVTEIRNCPATGCASGVKGKLNQAKNVRSPYRSTATLKTVPWWKS
jgi:hypothetical protein